MGARVLGAAGNDPQPVSVVGFGREDKEREEKGTEEEKEKEEEKEEEKVGNDGAFQRLASEPFPRGFPTPKSPARCSG